MSSWGLVRVSVAGVRREPDQRSEQMTQAIMGMALEILDLKRNWRHVRMPDGYTGWVNESFLQLGEEELIQEWRAGPRIMVTSPVALILSRRRYAAIPVSDAVVGTELVLLEVGRRWNRVALPDGRWGWLPHKDTSDMANIIHLYGGSPEEIIETALSFTGFPYLWGGTTPKGFDCSGFVQTVFRLNGHLLPRDAYQQFTQGEEIVWREGLKPADLLFFQAREAEKITHVAIHIGDERFIHCSGHVRTNSLKPTDEEYDASLEAIYVGAKRVVGGVSGAC
jgi:hypothetical protein